MALVGASGAGKSTLAALLLGFLNPTRGTIRMDGKLISDLSPEERLGSMAWVPQQPYLFHDTLAANLRLAKPDASLEEMTAAAKAAHLVDFIRSLPEGFETVIGEEGFRLSSGERQRLAVARAFLKNAPLLILDEPTSSLDPENEALLDESVHSLIQGRTVITIAHRLNTVFHADQIFVLKQGRLVETGTHAELLRRHGEYARLVGLHLPGEARGSYGSCAVPRPDRRLSGHACDRVRPFRLPIFRPSRAPRSSGACWVSCAAPGAGWRSPSCWGP